MRRNLREMQCALLSPKHLPNPLKQLRQTDIQRPGDIT